MISEIQNGLSTLKELRGLRNVLWAALLVGLGLVIFESVTQYFSSGTLRTKIELLESLGKFESAAYSKEELLLLHSELVEEAKVIFESENNPGSYLLGVLLRFLQGAYLSLPVFYFLFKGIRFIARNAKGELKENTQVKQMGMWLGSLLFSGAVWMATLLGASSVLWNKGDNLLISWFVFPFLSALILLFIVLWLVALRILLSSNKKNPETEG